MMSFLEIIKKTGTNNFTLKQKVNNLKNLIKYYYRLEIGIFKKNIFHRRVFEANGSEGLIDVLGKIDYKIIDEILTKNTKQFLQKHHLKNEIDFKEKEDFLQVGINTLFINEPFKGLWTTGKATFFLPLSKDKINKIVMEVFSIIPTVITVGQDGKILQEISIKKIRLKKIEIPLKKSNEDIVELFVDTEPRWYPNVITKKSNNIPMGVNIKYIKLI